LRGSRGVPEVCLQPTGTPRAGRARRRPGKGRRLTLVHQAQGVREGGVQRVLLRHQLGQVLLLHARRPPGPGRRIPARGQQRPRSPTCPPAAERTRPDAAAAKPGRRPGGGGGGSGRAPATQPGPADPQSPRCGRCLRPRAEQQRARAGAVEARGRAGGALGDQRRAVQARRPVAPAPSSARDPHRASPRAL
jgi:hypothetical protein